MTNLIPVSRPYFFGSERDYVDEALSATMISGGGRFVEYMETLISKATGRRFSIAVANGTVAIDLALEALKLSPNDEVIVPDFTMFSPIAALMRRRARLVPIDIDASWNIDHTAIEAAINEHTRGILMVHTYGHPAEAERICAIAREKGLWVLEDAAEALGAQLRGRAAGSFGDVGTFSFYANKIVTSGEGGAVVTDDPQVAEQLRSYRNLCFNPDREERFVHHGIGYNFRLSNLLAAIGCAQLENLDAALQSKRHVADLYRSGLADIPDLLLPPEAPDILHSYWVFGMLLPLKQNRRAFADRLHSKGIETRPFFHPLHLQPCLPPLDGDFPNTEDISRRGLYLPSSVGMSETDIQRVITEVRRALTN